MSMTRPVVLLPAVRQSLFIAGTDTGVGKTWVAVRLLRALAAAGVRAAGMKPVAAGALLTPQGWRNEDALALAQAASVDLPYELLNPCCLPRPTAPHLAAAEAGKSINIGQIMAAFESIKSRSDLIIVEGAGGWLAPIADPAASGGTGPTMQDIALALQLPVVLVVGVRLGCINHALLTADAIRRSGAPLLGWVANRVEATFCDAQMYEESLQMRLPEPRLQWADAS